MAQVSLMIGGRRYDLACRDGEEAHFQALAKMVDAKAAEAARAVGGVNESRQLLLAALLLADEMSERPAPPPPPPPPAPAGLAPAIERLADRLETVAARLEKSAGPP